MSLWLTNLPSWVVFIVVLCGANAIALAARDLAPSQLPMLSAYVGASAREWPRMCGGMPDERVGALLTNLERVARARAPAYDGDLYRQLPDRTDTHVALTILIGTALGAVFWVMIELGYPYCGSVSIGPEQITAALHAR